MIGRRKGSRTLYGHPEAGAHWENHLTAILKELGGKVLPSHPSAFWFASTRLLLTIYVDDLMLSGPAEHHETFWKDLMQKVRQGVLVGRVGLPMQALATSARLDRSAGFP